MRDFQEATEKDIQATISIKLQGHVRVGDTKEYLPDMLREVDKQ